MRIHHLLPVTLLLLSACKNSTAEPDTGTESESVVVEETAVPSAAESIALAHGFDQWEKVSELQFTWNIDRGDTHFERSFSWNPKTGDVEMRMGEDTVRYNRSSVDSLSLNADRAFINDAYWFLAPFNLMWDEGLTKSEPVKAKAPISGEMLNKLTITYSDQGGYTPGDAYDLFYGDDFLLREWVYRRGNQEEPSMSTTWQDYQEVEGLNLATMHQDSSGGFKLYFTGIEVKKQ